MHLHIVVVLELKYLFHSENMLKRKGKVLLENHFFCLEMILIPYQIKPEKKQFFQASTA